MSVTSVKPIPVKEVLELDDLALDPLGGSYEQFEHRRMNNYRNRATISMFST